MKYLTLTALATIFTAVLAAPAAAADALEKRTNSYPWYSDDDPTKDEDFLKKFFAHKNKESNHGSDSDSKLRLVKELLEYLETH